MIYVGNQVVKTQILEDLKIIILTSNKLIFSHLEFIQEYVAIPIVTHNPVNFYFSQESYQTLVQSPTTLQIYYCDWKTQAKLYRVIILNNSNVDSIYYDVKTGWNIYSQYIQYEKAPVTFHKRLIRQQQNIGQLSLGPNFYEFFQDKITKTNLSDRKYKSQKINWKYLIMVLKNLNFQLQILGEQSADNRDLICINYAYILIVKNYDVIATFDIPNICYFNCQLIINKQAEQQGLNITQIDNIKTHNIGKLPEIIGSLCSVYLQSNSLTVLQQLQNQVIMNKYPLVAVQSKTNENKQIDLKEQYQNSTKSKHKKKQEEEMVSQDKSYHHSDFAEQTMNTPSFGNQMTMGDKWTGYDKKWMDVPAEIQQVDDENIGKSSMIYDNNPTNAVLSRKVQCFRDVNAILTIQLINQIENSTFIRLLNTVKQRNPERIPQILQQFFLQIIQEAQSPFFIQETIKTYNPHHTSQKIIQIVQPYLNNSIYKQKLTFAFQQFKIHQVPQQILSFPKDFIKIIKLINKDIYIGDLLNPTQAILDQIVESYLTIQEFKDNQITIQDQIIEIGHTRNLLNILLYLNQTLCLSISSIIKVYCTKLLIHHQIVIIQQIIQEKVFQICQIDRQILDQLLMTRFDSLLCQSLANIEFVRDIVYLMSEKYQDEYRMKLSLIKQFYKNGIIFDLDTVLKIRQSSGTNISVFLQKIIESNRIQNLLKIRTIFIYRLLYCIEEGQKLTNITSQFLQIQKLLAEKCFENSLIKQGFMILNPLISQLKTQFIARLLFSYNDSIFINRLIGVDIKDYNNFQIIFPEYLQQDYKASKIQRDIIIQPKFSDYFNCTWSKFSVFFDKYMKTPIQVKILTYCDYKLAKQLFMTLPEPINLNFIKFQGLIEDDVIISQSYNQLNQYSYSSKDLLPIAFKNLQQHAFSKQENNQSDCYSMQELLLEQPQPIVCKSLAAVRKFDPFDSSKKAKSDYKSEEPFIKQQPQFRRLRVLVNQNQIYEALKDIYNSYSLSQFLKSLQCIDKQKIFLPNLNKFKKLTVQLVQINIKDIVPFQVLTNTNNFHNYKLMKPLIEKVLMIDNFWEICHIAEQLIGYQNQIAKIMIKKIVEDYQKDSQSEFIQEIILSLKLKTQKTFLKQMKDKAKMYNLIKTEKVLSL